MKPCLQCFPGLEVKGHVYIFSYFQVDFVKRSQVLRSRALSYNPLSVRICVPHFRCTHFLSADNTKHEQNLDEASCLRTSLKRSTLSHVVGNVAWCIASTKEKEKNGTQRGAAPPTEELQLVGLNCKQRNLAIGLQAQRIAVRAIKSTTRRWFRSSDLQSESHDLHALA